MNVCTFGHTASGIPPCAAAGAVEEGGEDLCVGAHSSIVYGMSQDVIMEYTVRTMVAHADPCTMYAVDRTCGRK